jgi:uncharacterized protein (UPF0548 family)
MFQVFKPDADRIEWIAASLEDSPLTYSPERMTREAAPRGWTVDHNRLSLGRGAKTFERGCEALKNWLQFDLGWVRQVRPAVPIELGAIAAVESYTGGLYATNFARVIDIYNNESCGGRDPASGLEAGERRRWGFAYGTLPVHVEMGEERFLIEMELESEEVFYDILAYSRPRHWLVRLGYLYARACQRRFARESKARMLRALAS